MFDLDEPEEEPMCMEERHEWEEWTPAERFVDTLSINQRLWPDWKQYTTEDGCLWFHNPADETWFWQRECRLYLCLASHRTWVIYDKGGAGEAWFYCNVKKTCRGQGYGMEHSPPFSHDERGPSWGRVPP